MAVVKVLLKGSRDALLTLFFPHCAGQKFAMNVLVAHVGLATPRLARSGKLPLGPWHQQRWHVSPEASQFF